MILDFLLYKYLKYKIGKEWCERVDVYIAYNRHVKTALHWKHFNDIWPVLRTPFHTRKREYIQQYFFLVLEDVTT